MSYNSGDDQSEDGELRQSPETGHRHRSELIDFSLSEEENNDHNEEDDGENLDSLDIKPPQANRMLASSSSSTAHRSKRRSHHTKRSTDRHTNREEKYTTSSASSSAHYHHHPRDKHHHHKPSSRSSKEHYPRERSEKDQRYYREVYPEMPQQQYYRTKEEKLSSSRHKYEEKKISKTEKHNKKYQQEMEDKKDSRADKTLQDLRERLLSKRSINTSSYNHKEGREDKLRDNTIDSALQGEAGMFVKEIINISTTNSDDEKRQRYSTKIIINEEEKMQQELRKEKLLEAEREMARVKEQSRMERERRRHMEKSSKRHKEDDENDEEEHYYYHHRKRVRNEEQQDDHENNVVEVSDEEFEEREKSERSEEESDDESVVSTNSKHSERSTTSASSSSRTRSPSRERSESPDNHRPSSPRNGRKNSHSESSDSEKDEQQGKNDVDEKKKKDSEQKIDDSLPPYYPAVQGCRSVEEFQCLNRIEEGTYGVVYRAKDKRTEDIVALKRLKMEKEKEGFPITSLREINTLLKGQHPNIVTVREIVVGSNMDKIFIVMDYVEHDLKSLMETMRHKKQNFTPGEVKCLLKQLLLAVAHLHDNWILHRDLKTSNLLLSHKGILKVGDFGLAREYGSPLKAYTQIVVTLWYRAPELLLGTKEYSTPIDMWSVGCIFAELLLMNALFPGKSEVDQLNRIFRDLGTPSEKIWPGFNKLPAVQKMKFTDYPVSNLRGKFHMLTELGLDLLTSFLTFDPNQRTTAEEALQHSYFNEAPLPIDPAMFPTWPAKSELGQKRALAASPKPPSGGGEYKKLGGDGDDDGYGFRIGLGIDGRRMGGGFSLKF